MTLQQLEYVVALDTHRHFVRAAEHCFVTQPTLTLQVRKLEEELGVQLFDRSAHPLVPTPAGVRFVAKARQILRDVRQLQEMVSQERKSLAGEYRIGVIPTLAPYLLPLVLHDFSEKYPEARLVFEEMQTLQILQALKADRLDIGLLVTPLDDREIREIPVFNEPFLVFASPDHPYAKQERISAGEIDMEDLWLLNQGHCFRNQVLNICHGDRPAFQQRSFSYESGSIETLKNMVRAHMGYTLVPELSVLYDENTSMVRRFEEPQPVREVSLVVHQTYSRETILEKLRTEILEHLPERFRHAKQHIKVRWR